MKISVLMENTAIPGGFFAEHGLSLYIELSGKNVLFDMGQSGAFADNAGRMGIDLKKADIAILSHGHYDHGGGIARFLEINSRAPVYINKNAFGDYFHGPEKYIGLDKNLERNERLIYVDGDHVIDDELSLHCQNSAPLYRPIDAFGLSVFKEGRHFPDAFLHEQYLLIRQNGRKVLISGCAHKGVVNIARWFRPDVMVGGFHLSKLDPGAAEDRMKLDNICDELLSVGACYYTGHCTGSAVYEYLRSRMGGSINAISAGMSFEVSQDA